MLQKYFLICMLIAVSVLETIVSAVHSEVDKEDNVINAVSGSTCSVEGGFDNCDGDAAQLTVGYNGQEVNCGDEKSKAETENAPSVTFAQADQVYVYMYFQLCSPYSSFEHWAALGCWLLLSCGCCGINALGNAVRVYPESIQGLMFYRSKI